MKPNATNTPIYVTSGSLLLIAFVFLHVLAASVVTAQTPKLKRLEYNTPADSLIFCGTGPYYVEDTVQVIPGILVDERQIYCNDCWSVYVRELSVSVVADEFREHIGDTVTINGCKYLPDSSRAVLQRFENDLGKCRLRRSGASANPSAPSLYYEIIFNEPTKYGRVDDYIRALDIDRQTVLGLIAEAPCMIILTSVEEHKEGVQESTRIIYGDLRQIEDEKPYVLTDIRGRVVSDVRLQPGVYFLTTSRSCQRLIVLP